MHWCNLMSIVWYKQLSARLRSRRLLGAAGLGMGALLYIKIWLPATGLGIPCVWNKITGMYSPGCGITRAVAALLEGQLYQAFRYNMLVFFLAPLFVAYWVAERNRMKRVSRIIMTVMLTATLLFGLLRNFQLLSWLAPTELGLTGMPQIW